MRVRDLIIGAVIVATFGCAACTDNRDPAIPAPVPEAEDGFAGLPGDVQEHLEAYTLGFGVEPAAGPELQIWLEEYVGGNVRGMVIRPGRLDTYFAAEGLGFMNDRAVSPIEIRRTITPAADEILVSGAALRTVRIDRCEEVMDGGGVTIAGRDEDGPYGLYVQYWEYCEGENIDLINAVIDLATYEAKRIEQDE